MLQAAAYIRVSTGDQTEYSPDAQLRSIKAWAAAKGIDVADENVFSDQGISGRTAERRPGFQRMIKKAQSRPRAFSIILVHRFDRFARSREDSVVYKSMLRKKYGVKVISVTESIEEEKFSLILEAMLEAMAEYYSLNLSDEVKKGMTEKALRGGLQTSPPFGYRAQDNKLVPVPDEESAVKMIFSDYLSGKTFSQISRILNAAGMLTRRGNPFDSRGVKYILENPVYAGYLRWTPDGRAGRLGSASTIVTRADHRAIINEENWSMTQEKLKTIGKIRTVCHPEDPTEN